MGNPNLCSTFLPQDIWLYMHEDDDFGLSGGVTVVLCEPNCKICTLTRHQDIGVRDDGERWLGNTFHRPSRDATGRFHALRSNEPHLYPDSVSVKRAPCYKTGGDECDSERGTDTCDCDPGLDIEYGKQWTTGDPICRDGTSGNDARTSTLADPTFFVGSDFELPLAWMFCRKERRRDMGDLSATMNGGRPTLYQTMFARSGSWMSAGSARGASNVGCVSNFLVHAIGKQHDNKCLVGPEGEPAEPVFYNGFDSAGQTRRDSDWRRFLVSEMDVSLARPADRHPAGVFPSQDAVFDLQNAAIGVATSRLSLNNMVKLGFDSPNNDLALWRETWESVLVNPEPGIDPTVYATLPDCRLRYSGCTVPVELVIVSAQITLSMVLHTVKHRLNALNFIGRYEDQIWASARFHLSLQLGARATQPDECPVVITNPTDAVRRLPAVVDDVLEYVDAQGRVFTPPMHAEWWGSRQALSSNENGKDGIWTDILEGNRDLSGGNLQAYHKVALRLNQDHPLEIFGMPTMHGATDKIQDFMGSVTVHLQTLETP